MYSTSETWTSLSVPCPQSSGAEFESLFRQQADLFFYSVFVQGSHPEQLEVHPEHSSINNAAAVQWFDLVSPAKSTGVQIPVSYD
jgi:hypothetical protein